MNTLLTLAIPTYNRVEKLKVCLERVLAQTSGKSVELLVSDNASTDQTEAFMTAFCKEHPSITYIRNPENIGPDRNFLNCYNRAGGEYILLLGDDDMLLPGAIDSILEALARKPVFVHVNSCSLLTQEPLTYTAPRVPEGELQIYTTPEQLLEKMGIYITFLSSFVLRSDLVRAIENKEQYIGTYFIQSHIAISTLSTKGEYLFVTKNCIAATGNESLNYDAYFVWGEMYHKLLMQTGIHAGLDPAALQQQHIKDLKNTIWGFVKYYRIHCPNSRNWNKQCIMKLVKPYPKLYIRYWATVYLPIPLVKLIMKLRGR